MPKSARVLLSSGTGATLARETDDGRGEFLVVLDITGDLVRAARPIEREWLKPTAREVVQIDDRVVERSMYESPGGVLWAAGTAVVATRLTP